LARRMQPEHRRSGCPAFLVQQQQHGQPKCCWKWRGVSQAPRAEADRAHDSQQRIAMRHLHTRPAHRPLLPAAPVEVREHVRTQATEKGDDKSQPAPGSSPLPRILRRTGSPDPRSLLSSAPLPAWASLACREMSRWPNKDMYWVTCGSELCPSMRNGYCCYVSRVILPMSSVSLGTLVLVSCRLRPICSEHMSLLGHGNRRRRGVFASVCLVS
jgi:hypothetical protein